MNAEFKRDYIEIAGLLIAILIGVIYIIRGRSQIVNFNKGLFNLIFFSVFFMILPALFINCYSAGRWDIDFIIAFLTLRETSGWFLRGLALFGYIFLSCGLTMLIIVVFNRFKKVKPDKKNNQRHPLKK